MKKVLFATLLALGVTPVQADPVTLSGHYKVAYTTANTYVPPPRPIHVNEYVVPEVYPSSMPQTWTWPLLEVPAEVDFGLGSRHIVDDDIYESLGKNQRVLDFDPERIELELSYWFMTPTSGSSRVEWRIVGDGTIVPEPNAIALGIWIALWVVILWRAPKSS